MHDVLDERLQELPSLDRGRRGCGWCEEGVVEVADEEATLGKDSRDEVGLAVAELEVGGHVGDHVELVSVAGGARKVGGRLVDGYRSGGRL